MTVPSEDLLRKDLAGAVAGLTGSQRLAVVEVAAEGVTTFTLHRDERGVPRCRFDRVIPWTHMTGAEGVGLAADSVVRAAAVPPRAAAVLVCSFPDGSTAMRALGLLREAHPHAHVHTPAGVQVAGMLRDILRNDPLDRPYELVGLKRDPANGRLELAGLPLFPTGARHGEAVDVTVRCEYGGERGTIFAIVAWARQPTRPMLLSMHSAVLAPGRHSFTALLERPGRVRIEGLPGLVRDERDWTELVASIPDAIAPRDSVQHVIFAAEVGGDPALVVERLGRIRQLVAASAVDRLSLISYGAHSYEWDVPEDPVRILAWEVGADRILAALAQLEGRTPPVGGHPHGAQLEDMLAAVVRAIGGTTTGRTLLLTLGGRPPHPARVDGTLLPCPNRYDWDGLLRVLEGRPGMTFAAVCDRPSPPNHPLWSRLGAAGLAHLMHMDIREFAARLGLAAPEHPVPFPLIEV